MVLLQAGRAPVGAQPREEPPRAGRWLGQRSCGSPSSSSRPRRCSADRAGDRPRLRVDREAEVESQPVSRTGRDERDHLLSRKCRRRCPCRRCACRAERTTRRSRSSSHRRRVARRAGRFAQTRRAAGERARDHDVHETARIARLRDTALRVDAKRVVGSDTAAPYAPRQAPSASAGRAASPACPRASPSRAAPAQPRTRCRSPAGRPAPPSPPPTRMGAAPSVTNQTRASTEPTTTRHCDESGHQHEAGARVAARAERMDERDRPAGVRQPVNASPEAVADPRAQQAREDEREQEVESDRPEAEPDRAIAGRERDERISNPHRRVAVRDGRQHVDGDEGDRKQRQVLVQPADGKARPARAAPARRRQNAERDRRGQQEQCDDAGAAGQVPVRLRIEQPAAIMRLPLVVGPAGGDALSRRRRARGGPGDARSSSQAGAASPRTIAAVAATFASTQLVAATLTHCHGVSAQARRSRVEDVVRFTTVGAPAPNGRARRREAARGDRDDRAGAVEGRVVVRRRCGSASLPAAAFRQPRCRRRAKRARRARSSGVRSARPSGRRTRPWRSRRDRARHRAAPAACSWLDVELDVVPRGRAGASRRERPRVSLRTSANVRS